MLCICPVHIGQWITGCHQWFGMFPGQKSAYVLCTLHWGVYMLHFIHIPGYVPGI